MYYFCIEDNKVISVLDYKPNVPASVRVIEIDEATHKKIVDKTHEFDAELGCVVPLQATMQQEILQVQHSAAQFDFLNKSDWKVMRHIRQQALGIPTSLTEEEYLELETQRQAASLAVKKPPTV